MSSYQARTELATLSLKNTQELGYIRCSGGCEYGDNSLLAGSIM
jgi:hypothetical protein